jgi:hypothetical protein
MIRAIGSQAQPLGDAWLARLHAAVQCLRPGIGLAAGSAYSTIS